MLGLITSAAKAARIGRVCGSPTVVMRHDARTKTSSPYPQGRIVRIVLELSDDGATFSVSTDGISGTIDADPVFAVLPDAVRSSAADNLRDKATRLQNQADRAAAKADEDTADANDKRAAADAMTARATEIETTDDAVFSVTRGIDRNI
jgi:hypothetical protein